MSLDKTRMFNAVDLKKMDVDDVLTQVYEALEEKGYNPINQIVGYLISGDPAYISNYKEARQIIKRVERDEIIEELIRKYIENSRR